MRLPRPYISIYAFDASVDLSPDVLVVVPVVDPFLAPSKRGPCLVGGTTTLDEACFSTKTTALSWARTVELLIALLYSSPVFHIF